MALAALALTKEKENTTLMAVPTNPQSLLGYWQGDQPSDWMRQGARVYISIPSNNTVPAAVVQMVAADPGIVSVDADGNLFTFDVAGTKAAFTWRWQP